MIETQDTLNGTVTHIVFTQPDNGFTVARLSKEGSTEEVVIVGTMPSLQPGECLTCLGTWKKHAQHGKQFEVLSFESKEPSNLIGIQKYLESGMIQGIGPAYAERIVKKFGLDTLQVIDENPERLSEIEGLGAKRIKKILSCWKEQRSIRDVMVFLRGHQVSSAYAHKIYKLYKDKSIERVKENPYVLSKEIAGIGFKTADKIADSLQIAKDSPLRLDAGIEYIFRELAGNGHTCYPHNEFLALATDILLVTESQVEERLLYLIKERVIFKENDFLWVYLFYFGEATVAREVQRLSETPSLLRSVDILKALDWAQEKLRIKLAKEQAEAVAAGLKEKMLIITGGPGTGKSTITKAILRISEKITSKILLAAPTGRAAKRMSEITYKKAFTIHGLLEMDFTTKTFKKNRENPLSCDLLIVDEASMIDTLLMADLLKAVPNTCRVIFIGDVDQLPSVGAGNVLKDFIESGTITTCTLKRIFRQARHSKIVTNAHRVNQGFFPDLEPTAESDFHFLQKDTPEDILQELLEQVQHKILKEKNIPFKKTQILSPMKKGVIGTENINAILQRTLNPSPKPLMRMGRTFHLHDKVMQVRNNYQKEIFNGDIGIINSIDFEEEMLMVSYDGQEVAYEFSELDELVLAYAVSIHKYQGSECDCILIPVHTTHFKMLNKNLLYTGITRGKKQVFLVGTKKAIVIAVKNAQADGRYTGLKSRLLAKS
jgi:exodeoxyribonuclease V alpha subunit